MYMTRQDLKLGYCCLITLFHTADQEAPYIHTKPVSKIVSRDRPAILDCVIYGYPDPTIKWFKDKTEMSNTTSHPIFLGNGTLHFNPVKQSDSGSYVCSGTNARGTVTSNPPAVLTVACKLFTAYPSSMIDHITFVCFFLCVPVH